MPKPATIEPQAMLFAPSGWVPNNPCLPVLFYTAAITGGGDTAADIESIFARHGWTGLWRNGIFPYQHFHATAHEVLGCACGEAQVMIGGPDGAAFRLRAGDVVVLPAGTGHCRLQASADFRVIGAYPPGQTADMCVGKQEDGVSRTIADVSLPATDPVYGADGPLLRHWLQTPGCQTCP